MTRFKIELIVESDFDLDQEEIEFYENTYINDASQLFLHSNEMGDSIGEVKASKMVSAEVIQQSIA